MKYSLLLFIMISSLSGKLASACIYKVGELSGNEIVTEHTAEGQSVNFTAEDNDPVNYPCMPLHWVVEDTDDSGNYRRLDEFDAQNFIYSASSSYGTTRYISAFYSGGASRQGAILVPHKSPTTVFSGSPPSCTVGNQAHINTGTSIDNDPFPYANPNWKIDVTVRTKVKDPEGTDVPTEFTVIPNDIAFTPGKPGRYMVSVQAFKGGAEGEVVTKNIDCAPGDVDADIYQVIKNPKLSDHPELNRFVDLVAGKNADVQVSRLPLGADLAHSTISWQGANSIKSKMKASADNGQFIFEFNPVPSGPTFIDKLTTMHISIKGSSGNLLAQKDLIVRVRKTKPVRIGFVPISGCRGKSTETPDPCLVFKTNKFQAVTLAGKGGQLAKAMFPVADIDFSASDVTDPMPISSRNRGNAGVLQDQGTLEKNVFTKKIKAGKINRVIGVVDSDYFHDYHSGSDYAKYVGYAWYDKLGILLSKDYPMGVPHEIVHTFSIRHENTPKLEGYLNFDISVDDLIMGRGLKTEQINLMQDAEEVPIGAAKGYWISPENYLNVFLQSLVPPGPSIKDQTLALHVSAGTLETGEMMVTNTYFVDELNSSADPSGAFTIETRDFKRNLISTFRVSSAVEAHNGEELISVDVPVAGNAVFVDIYKDSRNFRQLKASIVIPADIIGEELNYIPEQAIIGSSAQVRNKLNLLVSDYREKLSSGSVDAARETLFRQIIPTIQNNLTNSFTPSTLLDAGKNLLNDVSFTSFLRLEAISPPSPPANPFVQLELQGSTVISQRSHLKVIPLKKAENPEDELLYFVFFDGIKMQLKPSGNVWASDSLRLTEGSHTWTAYTYLVNSRQESSYSKAIDQLQLDKFNLQKSLDLETDPELRDDLSSQIGKIEVKINKLGDLRLAARRQLGGAVNINFEAK